MKKALCATAALLIIVLACGAGYFIWKDKDNCPKFCDKAGGKAKEFAEAFGLPKDVDVCGENKKQIDTETILI